MLKPLQGYIFFSAVWRAQYSMYMLVPKIISPCEKLTVGNIADDTNFGLIIHKSILALRHTYTYSIWLDPYCSVWNSLDFFGDFCNFAED